MKFSELLKASFLMFIIGSIHLTHQKIFHPCELGSVLLSSNIEIDDLGDWICLARAISRYNSSMIGGMYTNKWNNYGYGIFQIYNRYWCYDEWKRKLNKCNLNCSDLIDDDVRDDIRCAQLIHKSGGYSFKAWGETFTKYCKSDNKNKDFYKDCDFSNSTKPTITTNNTIIMKYVSKIYPGEIAVECSAEGTAPIEFRWSNDRKLITADDPHFKINTTMDQNNKITSALLFRHVNFSSNDVVIFLNCEAKNIYGSDNVDLTLKLVEPLTMNSKDAGLEALAICSAIVVTAALVTLVACLLYKYKLKQKRCLSSKEIQAFHDGDVENILINGGIEDEDVYEEFRKKPYNKDYEIYRSYFHLDQKNVLGAGEFGVVYFAKYKGEQVAVKANKSGSDRMHLKALLSELKVLISVKGHENVVNIIGAYTKELKKGILYILLEYCPLGSLKQYLRTYREKNAKHEHFDSNSKENTEIDINADIMVQWSFQLAKAMEYLSSMKVIHGDLATRNVLLLNHNTVKLTDFGLSRNIYYENVSYVKADPEKELLPWRWLALETLRDLKFSTSSDVWSFGVTIWEIFTYAEVPFAEFSWSNEFISKVEGGLRLTKPKDASITMHKIMENCWKANPAERPSFLTIRQNLYLEMTSKITVTQGYVQLDQPEASSNVSYRKVAFAS